MRAPLRFWGMLLGLVALGSVTTWAGIFLIGQGVLGRPAGATTVQTPQIETSSVVVEPAPATPSVAETPPTETPTTAPELTKTSTTNEAAVTAPVTSKKPVLDQPPAVGVAVPANWPKAALLQAGVVEAMNGFPGNWSIAVQDLTTGDRWSIRGDQRYHPASTIKVPVALYAMTQQKAGRLKWSDLIEYTEEDFESPGGGALEDAPFGGLYPVEDLVNRSLIYSNNIALNMLGRHLGWQNVRDFTKSIGGELFREADSSPSATAVNELAWWRYLYQVSLTDPKTANLVLDPLSKVEYDGRIAAGLPPGVRFVHKFGSVDDYYHDSGIVWAPHPYALVIMTYGAAEDEADTHISLATAAVHKVMRD